MRWRPRPSNIALPRKLFHGPMPPEMRGFSALSMNPNHGSRPISVGCTMEDVSSCFVNPAPTAPCPAR
jgi:hypothetical protein